MKRDLTKINFLITGATGFLGSFLTSALIRKGCFVNLLCRSKNGISGYERMSSVLNWFGINISDNPGIRIYEGNIGRDKFGLDEKSFREITENSDEIIHCASDTDFSEKNRENIETANISNLKNVIKHISYSGIGFFHYLSTAYISSQKKISSPETLISRSDFINVYEETKNRAEHVCAEECSEAGIELSIYRPSIVYGDSETGKSRKFNAMYFPVKSVSFIRRIMLKDIEKNGGKRAERMNVKKLPGGDIYMPIRMSYKPGSVINLIPVNYFVSAMTEILEKNSAGRIFHIVNQQPPSLKDLINYVNRYYRIKGISTEDSGKVKKSKRNGLEELFDSYIDLYLPYIEDERTFENHNTENIMRRTGIKCPVFDYEVFKRCIDYAEKNEWGRKSF